MPVDPFNTDRRPVAALIWRLAVLLVLMILLLTLPLGFKKLIVLLTFFALLLGEGVWQVGRWLGGRK